MPAAIAPAKLRPPLVFAFALAQCINSSVTDPRQVSSADTVNIRMILVLELLLAVSGKLWVLFCVPGLLCSGCPVCRCFDRVFRDSCTVKTYLDLPVSTTPSHSYDCGQREASMLKRIKTRIVPRVPVVLDSRTCRENDLASDQLKARLGPMAVTTE